MVRRLQEDPSRPPTRSRTRPAPAIDHHLHVTLPFSKSTDHVPLPAFSIDVTDVGATGGSGIGWSDLSARLVRRSAPCSSPTSPSGSQDAAQACWTRAARRGCRGVTEVAPHGADGPRQATPRWCPLVSRVGDLLELGPRAGLTLPTRSPKRRGLVDDAASGARRVRFGSRSLRRASAPSLRRSIGARLVRDRDGGSEEVAESLGTEELL